MPVREAFRERCSSHRTRNLERRSSWLQLPLRSLFVAERPTIREFTGRAEPGHVQLNMIRNARHDMHIAESFS